MRRFVRFRISRSGTPAWQRLKTLAQILILWSLALYAIPKLLVWTEGELGWKSAYFSSQTWSWVGMGLLLSGSALGLWSAWTMTGYGDGTPLPFDTARRLVVAGPYAYVRNPMAMSGITQMAGVALILGSPLVLAYVAAGFVLLEFAVRPWEEEDLDRRFGESHCHYRRNVPRWKIRRTPYDPERDNLK